MGREAGVIDPNEGIKSHIRLHEIRENGTHLPSLPWDWQSFIGSDITELDEYLHDNTQPTAPTSWEDTHHPKIHSLDWHSGPDIDPADLFPGPLGFYVEAATPPNTKPFWAYPGVEDIAPDKQKTLAWSFAPYLLSTEGSPPTQPKARLIWPGRTALGMAPASVPAKLHFIGWWAGLSLPFNAGFRIRNGAGNILMTKVILDYPVEGLLQTIQSTQFDDTYVHDGPDIWELEFEFFGLNPLNWAKVAAIILEIP